MAKILFVEDDALVRTNMTRLLTHGGHDVRGVGSARAAVAEAQTFAPELVVLDVGLPDFDGVECARRLRAQKYDGPLIFLTAYDNDDTVRDAIAQRAHAYLVKPITGAQLLPLVATALAASGVAQREQDRLTAALTDSREISAAVGVLAERNSWAIEVAFEALRTLARSQGRKIADVAAEVLAQRGPRAKDTPVKAAAHPKR
jgi:AmiR/NasT family two-component response regulator